MYGNNGWDTERKNGYGMEWKGFGTKCVDNNDDMQNMNLLFLQYCYDKA